MYGEDGGLIATDVEAKSANNFAWMCGVFVLFFLIGTWKIGGCEQIFGPQGAMYSTVITGCEWISE